MNAAAVATRGRVGENDSKIDVRNSSFYFTINIYNV